MLLRAFVCFWHCLCFSSVDMAMRPQYKEILPMSANDEKLKGTGEELKGKIKRGVGDLVNDPQLEAEGTAEELKGQGRREAAQAGERVRGAGEQAVGGIKRATGDLLDNPQLEAEGEAERLKGKAREQTNR